MKRFTLLIPLIVGVFIGCAKPPPPPPPAPTFFEHKVSSQGETFGIIASWFTGTSKNWELIAAANPEIKPNKIRIGNIIRIPSELIKRTDNLPKKLLLKAQKAPDPSTTVPAQAQPSLETSLPSQSSPQSETSSVTQPQSESAQAPSTETKEVAPPTELQTAPTVAAIEPITETSSAGKAEEPAKSPEEKSRDDLIDEILNQ